MRSYFIVNGKENGANTKAAIKLLKSKEKEYQYNDFTNAEEDEVEFLRSFIQDQFGVVFKSFPQIIYVEEDDEVVNPIYIGSYANLEKFFK